MIPRNEPIPALLKLIADWVPHLHAKHRMNATDIPPFVPPPLRAIYELAGNYPVPFNEQWRRPNWIAGLFSSQDQLLPPDQLKVDRDRFRFIHENQGVWYCDTVANESDPPVFSDSLAYEHGDTEFREICPTLSHFLTTFCLQEIVFGSQHLFCVDSEVESPADLIAGDLSDVWVNGIYVFGEPTHSFYLHNSKLFVMETGGYWLATNDETELKHISDRHQIRRIH